jgi:hypothetical protein
MLNGHQIALGNPLNRSHPLARGVAGFWLPLSNNSGGSRLFDLAGSNHGTLTNGPTWTAGVNGFGAVSLDGTDDYIECGTTVTSVTSQMAMACWMRQDVDADNTQTLICWGGTNQYWMSLSFNGATLVLNGEYIGYPSLSSSVSLKGTGWRHIGGQRTAAGDFELYLDGNLIASGAKVASPGTSGVFTIGRLTGSILYTRAILAGAVAYSRSLSAPEWSALYDQSRRGFPTLLNRTRRRSFALAAGGGGGGFQPAWAMRSTVVLGGAF